jgi:predicted  nucleic acid-binding Zn-ribbon protein
MAEHRADRPRKWASNAERMRAYRAVERERREALRGHHDISDMAERVVELTVERDRIWQQVVRLQQRIAQLENSGSSVHVENSDPGSNPGGHP